MLTDAAKLQIEQRTFTYWNQNQMRLDFAAELAKGGAGKRIAGRVEDETIEALSGSDLKLKQEYGPKGELNEQSMGDFWIVEDGQPSPVNVKTSVVGRKSGPNLVSIYKLIEGIHFGWLDSYYLLFVRFVPPPKQKVAVYLVDILDWFGYFNFEAGVGQLQLNVAKMFRDIEMEPPSKRLSMEQKFESLVSLHTRRVEDLIKNRKEDIITCEKWLVDYRTTVNQVGHAKHAHSLLDLR